MAKNTDTTIDVGSINAARELVFSVGNSSDHRYILQAPGVKEDYLETLERFPKHSIKRTTDYYIDDTDGQWFACFNVDCFDPPFAVIRARSFESAYEIFCDEFEKWIAVDATAAADYPEDDRNYNGNGTHIDTDNVQISELTLLSVIVA
ncbi:MAG TPA: hypothetical protein VNT76_01190 [Candidatus Binatus sp.]|nr:hypothetical protein [Candidatus Binatus sp.]